MKKQGKLIVLEGTDGSGKATQTARLLERLQGEGRDCRQVEFPRYGEESSALIRLYLVLFCTLWVTVQYGSTEPFTEDKDGDVL